MPEKKPTKSSKKEKAEKDTEPNKKRKKTATANDGDTKLETNLFSKLDGHKDPAEDFDVSAWVPLDLSPPILSSVALLKFSKPTAIQSATIPHILKGFDVVGKASTGSGKTLAFAIPIVEHWLARRHQQKPDGEQHHPTALVLSPTRELAHQITDHVKALCAGLPTAPYVCPVTGGLAVQKQQRQLENADVVIATPGRLWEVLSLSLIHI